MRHRPTAACAAALAALLPCSASAAHDLELALDGQDTDQLGRDVCGLGDVNGDGVPDLLVSRPGRTEAGHGRGGAIVLSGADWSTIHVIHAPIDSWYFGRTVGGGFDLDGDGKSEFIVADPIPDYVTGESSRVIVYSGADASVLHDLTPTGFAGTNPKQNFGGCAGGAGDLNDDGVDDFFISAHDGTFQSGTTTLSKAGAVIGYSGVDGSELGRAWGPISFGRFGRAVIPIGDYDGDGHDDLAATAAGVGDGMVYLLSGDDFSVITSFAGFDDSGEFGWSIASLGDVNDDGVIDFAVGDQIWEEDVYHVGRVSVMSGANGALLYHLVGPEYDSQYGSELATLGDYDGDGVLDFAVGARRSDVMLEEGSAAFVHSGADGALLGALYGRGENDEFGYAIANLGDLNADGSTDFAVGSYYLDAWIGAPGRLYVYTGLCDETTQYCDALPNSSGLVAQVDVLGSRSIAANDCSIRVTQGPTHKFGVFFYGFTRDYTPFGAGRLCVGLGSTGIHRLKPPHMTSAAGALERDLDFTELPLSGGAGAITPGATAHFQFWFRDTGGFNLSSAVTATFCW